MLKQQNVTDLYRLICNTMEWSYKLGLHSNVTPVQQLPKLLEELGEMQKGVQKANLLEIMDGTGDTLVVATVMLSQVRHHFDNDQVFDELLEQELTSLQDREFSTTLLDTMNFIVHYTELANICTMLSSTADKTRLVQRVISYYVTVVDCLHNESISAIDTSIVDCLKMAYLTIHYRSGKIENGIFVKVKPRHVVTVQLGFLKDFHISYLIEQIDIFTTKAEIEYFRIEFTNDDFSDLSYSVED